MTRQMQLPEGHTWKEFDTHDSMSYGWECQECDASFVVTNDQDGSQETDYTEGNGNCEE